jgi:O-antigen ligase
VYFNVGLLGVVTWLLFIATVCRRLYRLWKTQTSVDGQFIAIVGVLIFMLIKAMGSTVFVYLDASMLIMAGIVIYLVRQDAATEPDGLSAGAEQGLALSYGAAQ